MSEEKFQADMRSAEHVYQTLIITLVKTSTPLQKRACIEALKSMKNSDVLPSVTLTTKSLLSQLEP